MIPEFVEWQAAALGRQRQLRIDPLSVNQALGVLQSAFGEDWLRAACQRDPGHPIAFRAHPIGNLLTPPGDTQIVGLLELAEYLLASTKSSALPELIAGLKAQYGPTLLQLAFGFRLQAFGATEMYFEPPAQKGMRGDLGCRIAGHPVLVECYIPRVKRHTIEADWLLTQCMKLRQNFPPSILSIAIKLKKTPTAVERKTIVRIVRELCAALDAAAGKPPPPARFEETDAAFISVAPTVEVGPGENSLGVQHPSFPSLGGRQPFTFARVGVTTKRELRTVGVRPTPSRDHVAIWLSDADEYAQSLNKDLDEPLADLTARLERKLAQTKDDKGSARVLVVSTWITREVKRASAESVLHLHKTLFDKHKGVSGVVLARHTFHHDRLRYRYDWEAMVSESAPTPIADFLRALPAREGSIDVPALTLG